MNQIVGIEAGKLAPKVIGGRGAHFAMVPPEKRRQRQRFAGLEGAVMVQQVESESGSTGLNAATGELVDLIKAGVIDPAKVTRAALQNAASIAALLLTTEALVADKPEEAPAMPAMPGGGGMGGMGGMGF